MILIDSNHAAMRTLFMNKDACIENPEFFSHLIVSQFLSFAAKFGASKRNPLVIAIDSSSWRKEYYETNKVKFKELAVESYKGRRVKSEEIDWTKIFEVYNQTCESLKQYSDFFVMKVEKAEADDIIACLTKKFKNEQPIWIVSSDKDFLQLQETPQVNIYDPLKQQFKPETNIELWKKIHVMIGDSSDNIHSIKPRLGEKTALKMVKDLDILLQTNKEMSERYEFNRNLIDFDCIPESVCSSILEEYSKQDFNYHAMNLLKSFTTLRLAKHAESISKFKLEDKHIETKLNSHFKTVNKITSNSSIEDFFS